MRKLHSFAGHSISYVCSIRRRNEKPIVGKGLKIDNGVKVAIRVLVILVLVSTSRLELEAHLIAEQSLSSVGHTESRYSPEHTLSNGKKSLVGCVRVGSLQGRKARNHHVMVC